MLHCLGVDMLFLLCLEDCYININNYNNFKPDPEIAFDIGPLKNLLLLVRYSLDCQTAT